jgi:hypothetical protein
MPLLARWPGRVPAGRVSSAELMSADWPAVAEGRAAVPHHPGLFYVANSDERLQNGFPE